MELVGPITNEGKVAARSAEGFSKDSSFPHQKPSRRMMVRQFYSLLPSNNFRDGGLCDRTF